MEASNKLDLLYGMFHPSIFSEAKMNIDHATNYYTLDPLTRSNPLVFSLLGVIRDNDLKNITETTFRLSLSSIGMTAADGKEGWDIAQNQIPNIIISDIMMPVMDGIELCRHIKEDMRTSHIPVILLTAKDTLQDKEEGYAAGADSFITKPFSARLLNSRINNILENRRKTAGVITSIPETESEQENIENERKNLNKLDQEFLDKVTAIIEENLCMEKMDVAFIADKMCMSHSTLYRKIKGLTEMTVNEYVRKIKMKKGMELINEGKYSLAEISDLTGFSSVAYFRQCFKDEYGMAPTEYLKRKQN
jgi:YesN/AraC family two-component response regulator